MEPTRRTLNRTLLQRQHLLSRSDLGPLAMTEHLIGVQAQDPLAPYLSLAARIEDFDPGALSATLEARATVRLLLMRGTIHLVTGGDALGLRPFAQPALDRVDTTSAGSSGKSPVPRDALEQAVREVLAEGALGVKALGERLAERFPGCPATALAGTARAIMPLVQVPPRGLWKRSGGVVYDRLESWLGAELPATPDRLEVVRRYLRAFGPATAADLTAWSGVPGARALLSAVGDDLVSYRDESGRVLFDLRGLELADEGRPAPVRLLGKYDNVWLAHAARDRVTPDPAKRRRWMGANGGTGNTVFIDGALEGLWRTNAAGRVELELFREPGRAERSQLSDEVDRVESLLARR